MSVFAKMDKMEYQAVICFFKAIHLPESKICWLFSTMIVWAAEFKHETMNVRELQKLELPTKTLPKLAKW
jgi:hypothetical protein